MFFNILLLCSQRLTEIEILFILHKRLNSVPILCVLQIQKTFIDDYFLHCSFDVAIFWKIRNSYYNNFSL